VEVVRDAVDLGNVSCGTPKTHQRREVPVPRSLVDVLAEHVAGKSPEDLVLASRGAAAEPQLSGPVLRPAAVAIGMPGLTPHDLRHTAASLAVAAGAPT
jgi:integrase